MALRGPVRRRPRAGYGSVRWLERRSGARALSARRDPGHADTGAFGITDAVERRAVALAPYPEAPLSTGSLGYAVRTALAFAVAAFMLRYSPKDLDLVHARAAGPMRLAAHLTRAALPARGTKKPATAVSREGRRSRALR